jgi:hypothetical protein
VDAVAYGGVCRIAAVITLAFIRVQDCAMQRDVLGDLGIASTPIRVVAHPKTLLARLTRHHTDDGETVAGIGAVPLALIRAGVAAQCSRDGACFFPYAFWYSSSTSKAMPVIAPVGAVSFRLPGMRCCRIWSCLRDRPY